MSTWYRVDKFYLVSIRPVDVERFTDKSVWVEGRRHDITQKFERFFHNWEDAHAHALACAEQKLNDVRRALERAQGEYGNVKGMKKP